MMTARPIQTLLAVALFAALFALATVAVSGARGPAGTERPQGGKVAKSKPIYDGLWRRKVSPENKRWARRVSECESGRDPNALGVGGTYRGAFQFSEGTWKSAPQSPGGDPIAYSYRTQAFVAVRLRTRDGDGHWPSCA